MRGVYHQQVLNLVNEVRIARQQHTHLASQKVDKNFCTNFLNYALLAALK